MNLLEQRTLEEITNNVKMVKTLNMGDPIYIDDPKVQHICYKKNFRRPDWIGKATTKKTFHKYDEGFEYTSVDYVLVFAPNELLLDTYSRARKLSNQTTKSYVMGVDTAEYILETDTGYMNVRTGSDGAMADILEIYNGNKLEGIIVEMTADEYTTVEHNHRKLMSVFNER